MRMQSHAVQNSFVAILSRTNVKNLIFIRSRLKMQRKFGESDGTENQLMNEKQVFLIQVRRHDVDKIRFFYLLSYS